MSFLFMSLILLHATKVKHHIRLKDDTPLKQRPHLIHPQDYAAVRPHLQSLLDAGIIRERVPLLVTHCGCQEEER